MRNRQSLLSTRKVRSILIAVALISFVLGITKITNTPSSNKKLDSFGVCSGYSLKLLDQIPKGALDAVYKYLQGYQPVTILGNFSEVDPVLESSTPHRCPEVEYMPSSAIEAAAQAAAARINYSGRIPPGATKAYLVGVDHAVKTAAYTGNDPVIAEGIKNNPYTTSNIIVAYYPDKGWIGVYDDPGAYGGFHH